MQIPRRHAFPFLFPYTALFVSICALGEVSSGQTASGIIPESSEMGGMPTTLQRILVSGLEENSKIDMASFRMGQLSAEPAPLGIGVKCGGVAMALRGEAEEKGCKGDFVIGGAIPGKCAAIGMWVYLGQDANVASFSLTVVDKEDEYLKLDAGEVWEGWRWIEFDLKKAKITQAFGQAEKNGSLDFPIKRVNASWFSSNSGRSQIVVDGLVAITDMPSSPGKVTGEVMGGDMVVDAGKPIATSYLLTNYTDRPIEAKVDILLQSDPGLAAPKAIDPILGTDHAIGAKSWTEHEGKVVEEGALTDGNDQTGYRLPYSEGRYTEAFQFVDLGKERTITAMKSAGGDANWIHKVDVAASLNGEQYVNVDELQGIDFHGKWGGNLDFPITTPFKAQFIRFRYHNDGAPDASIGFPSGISVYDGIADEKWEIPTLGDVVLKESRKQEVPPHSFAILKLDSTTPLAEGAYCMSFHVKAEETEFVTQCSAYGLGKPLEDVGPDSRFGINGSDPTLAPLMKRLGVGWIRYENGKWAMMSDSAENFSYNRGIAPWNLNFDTILDTYTAEGLNVAPMMFMTPLYASSAPESVPEGRRFSYPPKDNKLAADFWFQTAARYGSRKVPGDQLKTEDKKSGMNKIKVYEVWNEQDLNDPGWGPWVGTMEQYYEMLRPVSEAVKRADPAAIVSVGGFAGSDLARAEGLRNYKYADGKTPLDFVDLLNFHYYSGRVAPELATMDPNVYRTGEVQGGQLYEKEVEALVAFRDKYKPGAEIWLSETGYDTAGPYGISERLQAARIPRIVMTALGHGMDKVFVYREAGSDPSQHAASGLVRNDRTLKPSFATYGTLIRQLDKVKDGKRLPYPDPNVRIYSWTRGDEKILSAWAVEGSGTLKLNLGNCLVTDAFGRKKEMEATSGLPLTEFPIYISNIPNVSAVDSQIAELGQAEKAKAQAEESRLSQLKARLFDFGVASSDEKLTIGNERKFAPVTKDKLFADDGDYGFETPAMADETTDWEHTTNNRTATRLGPNTTFSFAAEPGHYKLRVRISPLGEDTNLYVKGGSQDLEKNCGKVTKSRSSMLKFSSPHCPSKWITTP